MPRYYCDYCDTYLTHDSPSVRKQHNAGYKHKANVRTYYQQFEEQQTQSLIDQRIKEHLGQTAAFQQQVGATFHQHLASFQSNPQRPRLPVLPPPIMPGGGSSQPPVNSPLIPGMRPPILQRPVGPPGYGATPTMPSMMGPPGATSMPMQMNGLPRPPMMNPLTPASGGMTTPTSNGAGSMPGMYQPNPATATSGGFDAFNISASSGLQRVMPSAGASASPSAAAAQEGFSYAQSSETNH
ncbi:U1 small nuclear ribonucleoprotein C [Magnolia sinica]|uniref:U1 small nuclear ribonucleoprotein C n=1 Tax=Magnolia sinica TaxID=86752 RepID=UPI0026580829|nr:U1 small nuclear ribonucleoprotein C [Magnolia sinica]XP_058082063.1 U1 small nuclear ribonucleoprotein C [Magnolia sinica]